MMTFLGWFLLILSIPLIVTGWLATKRPHRYFGIVAIAFAIIGLAILKSQGIDPAQSLPVDLQ